MTEININKKYYIIDSVAQKNGRKDYFLFKYNMLINGCRYVHFNECTMYSTYEEAEKNCNEFNKYYKKGCPLNIIVSHSGPQIIHPDKKEVENRYKIQEISIYI